MRLALLSSLLLLAAAGTAQAKIAELNATCGPGIAVYSDGHGSVFIDGKAAEVTKYNDNAYDAKHGHTVISLTRNPDGTWMGVYTGKGGANGVCTMAGGGATTAAKPGHAKIIFFNATCGGGIDVHSDDGGPVYINGKEASLNLVNSSYFEASHGHDTISVATNPDGSLVVTHTGKGGANGVCSVSY